MAKVYVSTWGKYNAGSLRGKWISLNSCKDYHDFLEKCAEAHKDESDPEYMIQDTEELPDGLQSIGDWLYEEDFNDIKAVLDEEKKKASLYPKGVNIALAEEYMEEERKIWKDSKTMLAFTREKVYDIIKLENGALVPFEKPEIETSFCYGYGIGITSQEASDAADVARKSVEHFMHANLDGLDELIKQAKTLKGKYDKDLVPYFRRASFYNVEEGTLNFGDVVFLDPYMSDFELCKWNISSLDELYKLTDNDRKNYIAMLERVRASFKKRLDTYIKRYGLKKLHVWTYWADE
jgi:hypothetical protein